MFKDLVKIKITSGKGGSGSVNFDITKRPSGGTGGNGGNVYLVGSSHIYDLTPFKMNLHYKAENGERGSKNNQTGKNGEDLILKVPLATCIYDENGQFVECIEKDGEKKLLLKGGLGGHGNFYYRKGGVATLDKHQPGQEGEILFATLELELMSDIIFIGFPNAGKSSVLKELTNADAKVAPYEFTTINPQLGRMDDLVLMDLPGLIEGTYEGRGLGTKFVRHTVRSKAVAHFVSLESEDVVKTYKLIREELKNISVDLYEKPEIIVLTKSDLVSEKEIKKAVTALKKFNKNIVISSAYNFDQLEELKKVFKLFLINNPSGSTSHLPFN